MMRRFVVMIFSYLLLTGVCAAAGAQKVNNNFYKGFAGIYLSFINYSGSDYKRNGFSESLYANFYKQYHFFEFLTAYTKIDRIQDLDDVGQTDIAFSYTNMEQYIKGLSTKLGLHYIASSDNVTDSSMVLFGDFTYFVPYDWNTGLSAAVSFYPEHTVLQLSPHLGGYFYIYPKPFRTAYVELLTDYIHITKYKHLLLKKSDCFSAGLKVVYYHPSGYDLTLAGWLGERVFAVKNGGFLVYNISERQKGGGTFVIGYTFPNKTRLAFSLNIIRFFETLDNDEAVSFTTTVLLGFSF